MKNFFRCHARRLCLFLALLIFGGCAGRVNYKLSDAMILRRPRAVAVLPVDWQTDERPDADVIKRLFGEMAVRQLEAMNYRTVSLERVDALYAEKGRSRTTPPGDVARALGADAALVIRVTKWKSDLFLTYAYLSIGAVFELYTPDSVLLWTAEHSTRDSDLRLDRASMELAVIKAYEPRIERFTSEVIATLPEARRASAEKKKGYFDWLP